VGLVDNKVAPGELLKVALLAADDLEARHHHVELSLQCGASFQQHQAACGMGEQPTGCTCSLSCWSRSSLEPPTKMTRWSGGTGGQDACKRANNTGWEQRKPGDHRPGSHFRNSFIQFDMVDLGARTMCGPLASLNSVRYLMHGRRAHIHFSGYALGGRARIFTKAVNWVIYHSRRDLGYLKRVMRRGHRTSPDHRNSLYSFAETHLIRQNSADTIVVQSHLRHQN
jgi:hypothetical protein